MALTVCTAWKKYRSMKNHSATMNGIRCFIKNNSKFGKMFRGDAHQLVTKAACGSKSLTLN